MEDQFGREPQTPPAYLIFDGECGFCRRWIERWKTVLDDRVTVLPYQEALSRFPDIPPERFAEAVHFYDPARKHWSRGAGAVFGALAYSGHHRWAFFLYRVVPGFGLVSEWVYRWVASHRTPLLRITEWIWGRHLVPPGERFTVWIFLRLLASIYGIAFVSLWVQIRGLAGEGGIYPVLPYLSAVHERFGAEGYRLAPTLFWVNGADGWLSGACAAGALVSLALFLGFLPIVSLLILWALYLSLATVCRDFLWFQWDGLLLETGFLALFVASRVLWSRPTSDAPPSRLGLFLLRWLLFRLMVASALVKITSHDPAWHNLTALQFHYETQPLPTWTAWYAHHLPELWHRFSALILFVIEGIVPFFLFGPRRIRFAAAGVIATLQILILITGNYGFFNLLTLALCLLALDDGVWPAWSGRTARRQEGSLWLRPVGALLFLLSLIPLLGSARHTLPLKPLSRLHELVSPFRVVNPYGLFAVMTTRRPEIILEGSNDGTTWLAYEFSYKPGAPDRRPRFVAPHQPRLDWQMWFAALGSAGSEPWFFSMCQKILEGSEPVLALLEKNPFPSAPPRYLRARVFDYRFTDEKERASSGAWWSRGEGAPYAPVLTLEHGRLSAVSRDGP